MSIDLCEHDLPIRVCEICREAADLLGKGDNVLISRKWLTELIRDAHRYRFVKRGNSTHVLCGIWVPSPTNGGPDHWPDEEDVDEIIDGGMKMKEWK